MKLVWIFFCQISIKRLICVTINKATYTSETKTEFTFLAKNQCIQHCMWRGQWKSRHLNIHRNSLFGLAWQKIVRNHLTRLNILTQTEKEILVFYNEGHVSICQILWLSRKTFHKIPTRAETFRYQWCNTWWYKLSNLLEQLSKMCDS